MSITTTYTPWNSLEKLGVCLCRSVAGSTSPYRDSSDLRDEAILGMQFADGQSLRMRKVVRRSNYRPTGEYPSVRAQRMLQWESPHELNAMRLLDCDPHVTAFQEQPCEITYMMDGALHRHYPDLCVQIGRRKELWEVKVARELPRFAVRTALMQVALQKFGYSYRTVTAEELAEQPRLDNCRLLLSFGRRAVKSPEREIVRRHLKAHGSITWHDIQSGLLGDQGRTIVCRLAIDGVLTFSTSSAISAATHFFIRERGM